MPKVPPKKDIKNGKLLQMGQLNRQKHSINVDTNMGPKLNNQDIDIFTPGVLAITPVNVR